MTNQCRGNGKKKFIMEYQHCGVCKVLEFNIPSKCSECTHLGKLEYCSNCGADIRKGEEE